MGKVIAFIILTLFVVKGLSSPIPNAAYQEEIEKEFDEVADKIITAKITIQEKLLPLPAKLKTDITATISSYEISPVFKNLHEKIQEVANEAGEESKQCIDSAITHANTFENQVNADISASLSKAEENIDILKNLVNDLKDKGNSVLNELYAGFYYCDQEVTDPEEQNDCLWNVVQFGKLLADELTNEIEKVQTSPIITTTLDDLNKSLEFLLNNTISTTENILNILTDCINA